MNKVAFLFAAVLLSQSAFAAVKKPARAPAVIETTETFAEENAPLGAKLVVDAPATVAAAVSAPATVSDPVVEAAPAVQPPAPTAAEIAKLPEDKIPVLSGAKEVKKASSDGIGRLLTTLGIAVVALGGLLFGLKRYAKNRGPKKTSTKIQVLAQHALGPKKNLAIIQVAGESILIGITDHNISMIKTLALIDDEVPENTPQNFNRELEEFDEDDGPNFAVRGLSEIRDSVSTRFRHKN